MRVALPHVRPRKLWILGGALVVALALCVLLPAHVLAATPRPKWDPGPPWAPIHPHSSEMRQISDLFWVMLIISGIVFFGVTGTLIVAAVRFTARPGMAEPTQLFGNRRVELAWTIAPTLLLVIVFGVTVRYIHNINSPESGAIMNVDVYGHQWFWEFNYPPQPKFGITSVIDTADELHLPTGVNLHFHIMSHDVIHSFWTPQLQRQIDANPGQDNAVFVKLNQPGTYDGACYEYCGDGHAWMKYRVIVQTPSQFRAWVQSQVKNASRPTTSLARLGQKVFTSNTCISCHVITYPGSAAHGTVGPNLTHLASRWTVAAGAVPMTLSGLMGWIHDPNADKPGALMPGYPLMKPHDLKALATYLLSLK